MENAIWSMHLARQVAQRLGFGPPDAPPGALGIDLGDVPEQIVKEMTEPFRYLPPAKVREVLDFADFLRLDQIDAAPAVHRPSLMAEKLREVCDLALFLKDRYGTSQPADEKDYWTEEDLHDLAVATWRRLEEEDPWPEDEYPCEEQGSDGESKAEAG